MRMRILIYAALLCFSLAVLDSRPAAVVDGSTVLACNSEQSADTAQGAVAKCEEDPKSGGCMEPGNPCGTKTNPGVCTTVGGKGPSGSRCRCVKP